MFTITDDYFVLIPVSYNLFLESLKSNEAPRFVVENLMTDSLVSSIVRLCKSVDSEKYIVIDLKNVLSFTSRAFTEFLSLKNKSKVIFMNINTNSSLVENIFEDFSFDDIGNGNHTFSECKDTIFFEKPVERIDNMEKFQSAITFTYEKFLAQIIASTVKNDNLHYPLESSSIFGNTYVNLKSLFFTIQHATYIVYKMAECVIDNAMDDSVDAIVSASKTGAVFANLLGQLLNKKTVHCMGIGPKFSVSNTLIKNEIREGKNYLFVGDFVCLGTEIKILNALIINHNATLTGGICVSSFVNLARVSSDSILSRVKCLKNIRDCGVDYQISIAKEYFEKAVE